MVLVVVDGLLEVEGRKVNRVWYLQQFVVELQLNLEQKALDRALIVEKQVVEEKLLNEVTDE